MNQDLLRRAEKLNKVRQSRSRMNRATRILSLVIALSTIYALMLPAITINNDTVCGMEEHTHTEACYAVKPVLICGKTEAEAHAHTESCYTVADGYICGKQEIAPHVHTDACYGTQNRLTCSLLESEEHTHTESCYTSEKVLRCTLSTEGHIHGPECLGQERLLSCGREETEGHVHSDACYEDQRVSACGMEEHIHTAECYPRSGDDMADVETKEIWEAPLAALGLTDDWTQNVLKIAVSQLGYTESEANFRYVNGEKKGYSRYGAWYGDPYGDWCAMFVSFCLRYGGVPEELFPSHSTCRFWAELLYELGRFAPAQGTVPRPGDVVFFDTQEHISPEEPRIPDHVGLVVKVAEDKLTTIEGNINNSVVLREYDWDDPTLFGYGLLPEKPVQQENELTDGEVPTGEEAKHTDDAGEPQDNDDADAPEDTEPVEEPKDTEGETGEDKELSEELTDGDKDNDTDTENDTEAEKDSENDTDKDNETENETGLPEVKTQNIGGTKLLEAAMSIHDAAAGFTAEELTGDAKAFFVTACVELAELKDSIPCFENCAQWALELTQRGLLKSPADGYIPAPGDLVLFDLDADSAADSIGVVTDADSESGELVTLESDAAAQVSYQFYKLSDTAILGYYSTAESAVIPENTDAAEDADEKEETEEKEEISVSAESEDGVTVTITGQLPEGAQVVLTPVSEEVLAEIMASVGADTPVFAYDITIVDGEGQAWQPDELGVSVSITGLSIPEDAETEVTHVPDDGEITQVEAVVTEDTVEFTADGFSIYVVYYVGKEGEIDGESSTLHFENELISADLTVSPKLSEDAAFSIEKIDRTLEAEKWEIMSAPVLEMLKAEQGETEEIPVEENAETEKEEGIRLYALKLTADGQELSLDDNYAVKLEARLNVTAPEEEEPEPGEAIRIFALNHEEENREQKKENPVTENIVSDDPLAGIIPEALVEKASDSEASQKKYTATPLKASLSKEQQSVGVDYTGEGLDGLAMLTATPGDAPTEGTTGGTASPVSVTTELAYHKKIDWYGNKTGATTADKDKYRLYLDAGPLQYSEPMDLLIVVDRSYSMSTGWMGDVHRDAAVSQILNGTAGNEGLISKFFSLHEENELAVIAFFGEQDAATDPFKVTNGNSEDIDELRSWISSSSWNALEDAEKNVDCRYRTTASGKDTYTDYCAALLKMKAMLDAKQANGHQKMVIFLSDGVPTYYLQNREEGGYTRLGTGDPNASGNVTACANGTEAFFDEVFAVRPAIYSVAIGTGEDSFSTDVLEYMSGRDRLQSAGSVETLTEAFEDIIYGAAVELSDLTISDTLSDYVDMVGNIKVTSIKGGTEMTLYERAEIEEKAFTDTGKAGKCTVFESPLQSVSYDLDPETKKITKITAVLDDTTYGLDTSTQYILSFDVKTSASASVTYSLKERYTDTGDEDTDYTTPGKSSGEAGFYSNKEATLSYILNDTEKTAEYPKPVVQVVEESGGSSGYTAHGYITQNKTIDWLGDNKTTKDNPDTDLDDGSATKDKYRLYLNAGQYKISEPIDLLIVVDKSNSMNKTDMKNGKSRYQVIEDILNSTDSKKGFIESFLDMDEGNRYAVVSFGGEVDGGHYNSSMTRLYTRDSESVRSWGSTVPKGDERISCTPNSKWGTNYSAAMYRARDMLRAGRNGIRKLMIFISDGEPTFWMTDDDTRYGDGSKSKSFSTGSYKIDNIPTRTINVTETEKRIAELRGEFPNMGLYVIGVADPGALDRELLNYMATGGEKGVYTSLDYDELLTAFENILYGNAGDFKALKITDTLSDYVELYNNNADILVTLTESSGTTNKLYERPLGSTVNFTDTPGMAESYFTKDGKQLLTSVSYDAGSKTITAQFNPNIKLTKSSKYELSFNVKVTDQAKEEYEKNVLSERDPYAGMAGDKSTDYPGNTSSSEKPGFRSNLTATAAYSIGGTAYNIPYDHPVVQTKGSILNLTVKKNWSVEPEDDREVKIKLYSSPNETTDCTFVQEITLNKGNDWEARVEGLKRSDASGQELHYYILETPLDGYLAVYAYPVYNLTIGDKVEAVAGEAQIPETPTGSVYEGTAEVTNNPGVVLPETGGSGEALYTDLGILLLAMGFMLMAGKTDDRENNLRKGRIQ